MKYCFASFTNVTSDKLALNIPWIYIKLDFINVIFVRSKKSIWILSNSQACSRATRVNFYITITYVFASFWCTCIAFVQMHAASAIIFSNQIVRVANANCICILPNFKFIQTCPTFDHLYASCVYCSTDGLAKHS